MLAKELHDVAPGVIAGLDAEMFSGMKVGLASVDQSGMNNRTPQIQLRMRTPPPPQWEQMGNPENASQTRQMLCEYDFR